MATLNLYIMQRRAVWNCNNTSAKEIKLASFPWLWYIRQTHSWHLLILSCSPGQWLDQVGSVYSPSRHSASCDPCCLPSISGNLPTGAQNGAHAHGAHSPYCRHGTVYKTSSLPVSVNKMCNHLALWKRHEAPVRHAASVEESMLCSQGRAAPRALTHTRSRTVTHTHKHTQSCAAWIKKRVEYIMFYDRYYNPSNVLKRVLVLFFTGRTLQFSNNIVLFS